MGCWLRADLYCSLTLTFHGDEAVEIEEIALGVTKVL
jgi:hypothetical protein